MWVVLKVGQVMGHMRPASATSEAVTSHRLFGVSKNIEGSIFRGQHRTLKVVQRPQFRGTGLPQIRPPRSLEAINEKIVIF